MSIDDLIRDRVARKMLCPLLPKAKGSPIRRAMFVDENLQAVLDSPIGTAEWEQRVASLRADLEAFVTLKDIGPKYLFLLYPGTKGVWEIRSVQEEPSVRVLGLFAARDVFVATNYALREDLGAWQSRAWKRRQTHGMGKVAHSPAYLSTHNYQRCSRSCIRSGQWQIF